MSKIRIEVSQETLEILGEHKLKNETMSKTLSKIIEKYLKGGELNGKEKRL